MRRPVRALALALAFLLVAILPAVTTHPVALAQASSVASARIMVVGDSITQGSAGDFTWRHRLFRHLTASSVQVDLVGPRDDLYDNVANRQGDQSYADPNFDRDHAAVWGQSIIQAKTTIETDVRTAEPEYLLILLGINDLSYTTNAAQTEANLRTMLASARAGKGDVKIVLGTVLPTQRTIDDSAFAAQVTEYNGRIATTATQLSTPESPIAVADSAAGFAVATDLWDGTHANARGEYKIAAAFADTLAQRYSVGAAYPRPLPNPAVGPLVAPALTASARDGGAELSWTPSPGATGYWVWTREAGVGEFSRLPIPLPISSNPWTAGLLTNGTSYEFKLQTTKGNDAGVYSNTVTVRPDGPAPAPPTDLRATARDGEALLEWTSATNATGYYVWTRNVTAGEPGFTKLPYPVTGTSWTAGMLVNGTQYEFKLQPANGGVLAGYSNTVAVVPTGPAPGAVTGLAVANGDGQAVLSWTSAVHATGYYIWTRNVTAGETQFTKLPFPVSGTTWTAGLLVNGGVYEFKLQSVNGLVQGATSAVVTARPTGPTPAAVTGLSVANGNGKAVLTWTPAANATGYWVWTRNVTAGEGFTRLPFAVSGSSWTAGLLVNGGVYEYKLQSVNGLIDGATSAVVTARPTGPTPGGAGLSVTNQDGQAVLSWTAAANATGYYVWTRNVTAGEGFAKLQYPVSGSSWTADLLVNGAVYEFKLQSVNGLIEGGFSNTVTARPSGPTPGSPELTVLAGNRKAALIWSTPQHATSYYIWTRNVTAGEGFTRLPYPVDGSSWTAELLTNGARYEFKIQAYNGLQAGGTSAAVGVTPTGPPPPGPSHLTARSANHAAVLQWTEADQATGYYVWTRNVTAGEGFARLPYPVSGGTWTASLLVNGAGYEFKLQSVDGLTPGGYSNTVSVTPLGPTPQGPADLVAHGGFGEARLSWSRISTASGFLVQMRNVTRGEGFTELPYPLTGTSWTAGLLIPKDTYEFRLVAVNDLQRGNFSNTARVVLPAPPSVTGVRAVGAPYAIDVSWNPVPGADSYNVYMGYGDASLGCFPPSLENMRLVQWGLPGTRWRQEYVTGMCAWYLVAASKNGVDGAVTFDFGAMAYANPLVNTTDHFYARNRFFDRGPDGGDKRALSRIYSPSDRGIVVGKAFIRDDGVFTGVIGDHRQWSSAPYASAKLAVAWDTATGEVSVYLHRSCVDVVLANPCRDSLPIELGPMPSGAHDWFEVSKNYVNLSSVSGGGMRVEYKVTNSWSGMPFAPISHIDGVMTFTPSGNGFRVDLTADRFPAYEFYVYPRYSTVSWDVRAMGIRDQTSINDLSGVTLPPFQSACWASTAWTYNQRMSC